MSCKLWGKVTSVLSISILVQKCQFCAKKNWNFGRNVDFFINCALLLKVIIFFCKICLFLEKCDFLKNSKDMLICIVLIFIQVFHLLESCYFDSKYHFLQWNFGQECHFPSKIYIALGIHSWEKLSNVLRKVLI